MHMRSCGAEHADVPAAPYRRYLATGQLILVLACVALFGCRDISPPTAPPEGRLKPDKPSYDVYGCSLGTAICSKIDSAITALENDGDTYCQGAGHQARSRFVSTDPNIGFSATTDPNYYAKVDPVSMNTNPSDYFADGRTQLNMSAITGDGLYNVSGLEKLIAHEEYHHYGYSPYHSQWDLNWNAPGPPPPPCTLAQFDWP
jgi:hypothetical protein